MEPQWSHIAINFGGQWLFPGFGADGNLFFTPQGTGSQTAPLSPKGASVDANIELVESLRLALMLQPGGNFFTTQVVMGGFIIYMVRPHGEWDYKQYGPGRIYEDFGNFNFGAVASAAGFGDLTILRLAGFIQKYYGAYDPSFGDPGSLANILFGIVPDGSGPPWGDDPNDQSRIIQGIAYYDRTVERRILPVPARNVER